MKRVAVVGSGISGAACAAVLREAGIDVEVFERADSVGGRMASPELDGRPVDLGAAYLTVTDPQFQVVVDGWLATGLVREWTDTFDVWSSDEVSHAPGPMRFAAPGGLRQLVRDLHGEAHAAIAFAQPVRSITELPHDAVVLAMPDPQARRLLHDVPDGIEHIEDVPYDPVIAIAATWTRRCWSFRDAVFVNDDPDLAFVADDGARRGDGAAVLVAHTTATRARAHLDTPDDALGSALVALRRTLDVDVTPSRTHVHRWRFAKPANTHGGEPFAAAASGARLIGFCGDSWCPAGSPRVEAAWLSGHRLGAALTDLLA